MGRVASSGLYWLASVVVIVGMGVGATACQPLYGGKPEKLQTPSKKKRPPDAVEVDAPIKYIDDCKIDFRGDPKLVVRPQSIIAQAQGLTADGDNAIQNADKTADPQAKVGLIRDAIQKYVNALKKDPYNAEATLNLARAYDQVLRKGCALALLKRLSALAANPKFARDATLKLDSIDDNSAWFKGYRKDAMSAAGK